MIWKKLRKCLGPSGPASRQRRVVRTPQLFSSSNSFLSASLGSRFEYVLTTSFITLARVLTWNITLWWHRKEPRDSLVAWGGGGEAEDPGTGRNYWTAWRREGTWDVLDAARRAGNYYWTAWRRRDWGGQLSIGARERHSWRQTRGKEMP